MRHLSRLAACGPGALLAGFIFSASALAAPTHGYRVLHQEAVEVATRKGVGASEHMSFEAYGRRFEVTVAPNERIRRGMPANLSGTTMPLQGTVDGLAGSWVRITRSASGLRGMVFDGREMYAVEPASEVAPVSVEPLNAASGETVVYRLSDALMPVETMSCELAKPDSTPESPPTAADAFQQLTSELHTSAVEAEATALKQVRVGVVGDFEFVSQFTTSTPEDAIVARMNIVDGIFSSQLGVKVSLATPTLFRTATDPFTKTAPKELLSELQTFRNGSPAQKSLGITHLMTGRNLDDTTVGIAYISRLCDARFGASLSQSTFSTNQSALIAAHEIGHNFGAPHDGDSDSACKSTPTTNPGYLMAPQLNGKDKFSPCSIAQITPVISAARCLTTYAPPDASIEVSTPTLQASVGTALVASFTVRATGDDASANVIATVALPTSLTIQSATANGGTCTTGAGTASCNFGSLAAGDARQVDLNVTATAAGSLTLNLSVDSSNDPNSANDTGSIAVTATGASTPPPPTTPPPSSGSSGGGEGGGGSMDLLMLAALGGTLLLRRKRR